MLYVYHIEAKNVDIYKFYSSSVATFLYFSGIFDYLALRGSWFLGHREIFSNWIFKSVFKDLPSSNLTFWDGIFSLPIYFSEDIRKHFAWELETKR